MMATIEDLSPDELLKIFSHYIWSEGHEKFLRNVPRVCKHWNELSSDSSLWRNVKTCDWKFLVNVSRRGLLYNTQSLEVDEDGSFTDTNLSAVLENIRDLKVLVLFTDMLSNAIKLVTKHCPHLEHLYMDKHSETTLHEWNRFLTVCGPTLKHLHLVYKGSKEEGRQLLSVIAAKCPQLETLEFLSPGEFISFPIYELRSGCPKMRELIFGYCCLITAGGDDTLFGCGFKNLKKFSASCSDFDGVDIHTLLKDSMDLEYLELFLVDLVLGNISRIPSEKIRFLKIVRIEPEVELKVLKDAVYKWRRTLSVLDLRYRDSGIRWVLEDFLDDNPDPQLESLSICEDIDLQLLEEMVEKCQNLIHLNIEGEEFKGREKIKEALECHRKGLYI